MKEKLLKLLYKSFDDMLTDIEQQQLDNALVSSKSLREAKEEIMKLRKTISNSAEQSFSPYFADRVMQIIEEPKNNLNDTIDEYFDSLFLSFRRIALAGTVVVLALLVNNFISGGGISLDAALSLQQVSIEDVWSLNDLITETIK